MSEISAENKIKYNEVLFKFEQAGRYGEVVVSKDTGDASHFVVRKRNFFGWLVSNVKFTLNIGGYKEKVLQERRLVLNSLHEISANKDVRPPRDIGRDEDATHVPVETGVGEASEMNVAPDVQQNARTGVQSGAAQEFGNLGAGPTPGAEDVFGRVQLQFPWNRSRAEQELQDDLREAKGLTAKGGAYRQKVVALLRQHAPISLSARKVTTLELVRLYSKSYQIDDKTARKNFKCGSLPINLMQFVQVFEKDPSLGFNPDGLDAYLKENDFFQNPENLELAKEFALFILSSDKLPHDNDLLFLWNEYGTVDPRTGNHKNWKCRGVNTVNPYFSNRMESFMRLDEETDAGQTTGKNEIASPETGRERGPGKVKSRKEKSADRFLAREWVQFKQAKVR